MASVSAVSRSTLGPEIAKQAEQGLYLEAENSYIAFCEEYHGKNATVSVGGLAAKRRKQ